MKNGITVSMVVKTGFLEEVEVGFNVGPPRKTKMGIKLHGELTAVEGLPPERVKERL